MNWLSTLNNTYLNVWNTKKEYESDSLILPISHTTQLAEIELTIDLKGNFIDVRVITDKDERQTLVPCTEDSASRSGPGAKLRPHPLHDKLQYVAGDYVKYGGEKGPESYEKYIEQLERWVHSPYSLPELHAICEYLKKACLVSDLIDREILFTGTDGHLLEKWTEDSERPAIFGAVAGAQNDAFVRFNILSDDLLTITNPWEDSKIIQSWVDFYESTQVDRGLDYITGELLPLTSLHPKKIRHTGDTAKLLSSNDTSNFTYRGRFETADESSQVAYRVSQQAHNALKWLIQRQGTRIGERVFLIWGTGGEDIPNATLSSQEIVDIFYLHQDGLEPMLENQTENVYITQEGLASEFNRALRGYKGELKSDSNLAIIVLDAATPGRMAITFYREYLAGEVNRYFNSLSSWHKKLSWQNVGYSKRLKETIRYVGAPSLKDIAQVAFGVQRGQLLELDDKVMAQTVQRIFPCVINEDLRLPSDIVRAVFTNALYPQKYSDYNWSKVRGVACSLIRADRNQRWKENWTMEVDRNTGDLTYNFGRWMAVLDEIETRALWSGGEKDRTTAVARYFSKLAERPCATTEIVMKQLVPYRAKLGPKGNLLYKMEQEIASTIHPEEFLNAKNLDGRFLLGFDAQKYAIYKESAENREKREQEELEDFISDITDADEID